MIRQSVSGLAIRSCAFQKLTARSDVKPVPTFTDRAGRRAVAVLSLTEILAWGILIYPPVLIVPHLAADHGWSLAFGMAGFSIGLVTSGILSPSVCGLIDRHGGNIVMSLGALAGALGLVLLTMADQRPAYL